VEYECIREPDSGREEDSSPLKAGLSADPPGEQTAIASFSGKLEMSDRNLFIQQRDWYPM